MRQARSIVVGMSEAPSSLTAVSPYGPGIASYRERVTVWLDRIGMTAVEHWYYGPGGTAASIGPSTIGRSLRAEVQLRRLRRDGASALLVHREASPFSTGKLESDLLASADRSVYDIDDALYADWGADDALRRIFSKAGKAAACVEAATITIAGNETVAEWANTLASDVRVIPTCVNPSDHPDRSDYELGDPPRILWVGSPSTTSHLELVGDPLLRLNREMGAELILVGGTLNDSPLATMTTAVPWSRSVQNAWLEQADVGIMPLTDSPFERGKCGYKLLQYAGARLPAVASPVGVNRAILDRTSLPAAETVNGWYEALHEVLTESASKRARRADRAHAAVVEHYSFEAWEPAWRALLADLAGSC